MQVKQTLKELHKPIKISRQPLWVGWFFKNINCVPISPCMGKMRQTENSLNCPIFTFNV